MGRSFGAGSESCEDLTGPSARKRRSRSTARYAASSAAPSSAQWGCSPPGATYWKRARSNCRSARRIRAGVRVRFELPRAHTLSRHPHLGALFGLATLPYQRHAPDAAVSEAKDDTRARANISAGREGLLVLGAGIRRTLSIVSSTRATKIVPSSGSSKRLPRRHGKRTAGRTVLIGALSASPGYAAAAVPDGREELVARYLLELSSVR